jgi:hypothetical protein
MVKGSFLSHQVFIFVKSDAMTTEKGRGLKEKKI